MRLSIAKALLVVLPILSSASCKQQSTTTPIRSKGVHIVELDGDDAYVIDANTKTCGLMVAGNATSNLPVSCWKLAEHKPSTKELMPWVKDLPPPSARPIQNEETPIDDSQRVALLAEGIRKTDAGEYELKRSFVEEVMTNPMAIARGARVVPSIKDGKANGFKLYAIRPSSVYAALGLANGDTVHAVNGMSLASPEKALEVYVKAREATTLVFDITRRGQPLRLTYRIVEHVDAPQ